jgi:SAM-dependent methyltransferase
VRDAVLAVHPSRVLEVGCGTGEFAVSLRAGGVPELVALDISPKMVEIAASRGVDARLGDVQRLPFADRQFDCAVAAWMLYHVPDLNMALSELTRVLTEHGRLVVGTIANDTRPDELDRLLGAPPDAGYTFSSENGHAMLLEHFQHVDQVECLHPGVPQPDGATPLRGSTPNPRPPRRHHPRLPRQVQA